MGTAVPLGSMPEIVRGIYDRMVKETGVEPTVERNGYGRILFTHQNDRVRVTVDFRLSGRTWRWADSKLFIDGKRVCNAENPDVYIAIFKDPDHERSDSTSKDAVDARPTMTPRRLVMRNRREGQWKAVRKSV